MPPPKQTSKTMLNVLGANIRRLREERGLSQRDLARAARLQPADLSRIETGQAGERGWGLVRIHRLAKALKVSPSDLLAA